MATPRKAKRRGKAESKTAASAHSLPSVAPRIRDRIRYRSALALGDPWERIPRAIEQLIDSRVRTGPLAWTKGDREPQTAVPSVAIRDDGRLVTIDEKEFSFTQKQGLAIADLVKKRP